MNAILCLREYTDTTCDGAQTSSARACNEPNGLSGTGENGVRRGHPPRGSEATPVAEFAYLTGRAERQPIAPFAATSPPIFAASGCSATAPNMSGTPGLRAVRNQLRCYSGPRDGTVPA